MTELPPVYTKETEPFQRALRIGIMGAMASGKSTLATLLGEEWGVTPTEERWEENPYLEAFYDNPKEKGVSFKTQLQFLTLKVEQMKISSKKERKISMLPQIEIIDPTIEMDARYGWAQAKIGLMRPSEYETYKMVYEAFKKDVISPIDLYVFADAPPDVLLERILDKRKREFEHPEFFENYPDYLTILSNVTRAWCEDVSHKHPVVFVDTVNNNFADDIKTGEKIVVKVEDRIRDFFMKSPHATKDMKVPRGRDGVQLIIPDFLKIR